MKLHMLLEQNPDTEYMMLLIQYPQSAPLREAERLQSLIVYLCESLELSTLHPGSMFTNFIKRNRPRYESYWAYPGADALDTLCAIGNSDIRNAPQDLTTIDNEVAWLILICADLLAQAGAESKKTSHFTI